MKVMIIVIATLIALAIKVWLILAAALIVVGLAVGITRKN